MAVLILTAKFDDPWTRAQYARNLRAFANAGRVHISWWRTGNRRSGVSADETRVFLLRQGSVQGLVASGFAKSEISSTGEENSVRVEWDTWLAEDELLPPETLIKHVPEIPRPLRRSGVILRGDAEERLEGLWADHLAESGVQSRALVIADLKRYSEGAATPVERLLYQRSSQARADCLRRTGYACAVCGFDFEKTYGERGHEFIHVHHVVPVSFGPRSTVSGRDLVPVCANCHNMLHRGRPLLTVAKLKAAMKAARR